MKSEKLYLILFLLVCISLIVSPVLASGRIYPISTEWQITGGGHEHYPVSNAFDGNAATWAEWSDYRGAMIKITVPDGAVITEIRYKPVYADDTAIENSAGWYMDTAHTYFNAPHSGWVNLSNTSDHFTSYPLGKYGINNSTFYLHMNGMPMNMYEVEFYGTQPLSASFSAIPQSGNATLNVNFTPLVVGENLNRVVWDFDGGLGTETKTIGMNDSFVKSYSTAGHFIARLTAYDNAGNSVTASKNIDAYNYGMGITPTPTLTPTPTATLISVLNKKTIIGVDINNRSPISGLSIGMIDTNDIGSGWCNVTANNGSYTFSYYGSPCNKAADSSHIYEWVLSKTGYKTEINVESFGIDGTTTVYLSPSSYTPAASNFVLQSQLVDQNYAPIQNPSGTIKLSNQSSTWSQTITYSGSSYAVFTGLTPSASYKINIDVIGYQSYTDTFSSSSSMGGTTQYYQAVLTSSSALPSNFQLNVNPSQGTPNDTYTLTLVGDLSNAQQIDFTYSASDIGDTPFTDGAGLSQYRLVSGSWKQFDGSSWSISSSAKSVVNGKFRTLSQIQTSYTPRVTILSTSGNMYYAYGSTISFISGGSIKTRIRAYAGDSAGIMGTNLYPAQIYIYNIDTGEWTNKTITLNDMVYGTDYTNLMAGSHISYSASSNGYKTAAFETVTLPSINNPLTGFVDYQVILFPNTVVPVGNASLYCNVDLVTDSNNLKYSPAQNARITLSDNQTCNTNVMGSCSFTVLSGGYYSGTASFPGYSSIRQSIVVSDANSTLNFHLIKIPTTTSPYANYTVSPIGYITTMPISAQYTVNATEGASCAALTANSTLKDQIMSYIACNGVGTKEGQNAMLALVIMIFSGILLGKVAKGIGAISGVVAGAAVSFYMALLPFWIIVFVCICAGIVFAGKIFWQGGK